VDYNYSVHAPKQKDNWPEKLRQGHIKVCTEHVKDFYRTRNQRSAPAQRRHYVEKRKPQFKGR